MNPNPKRLLRPLLAFAALSLAACTEPRSNALSALHHADAAELRTEVAQLSTRLFPSAGPMLVPVRPEQWPPALLKLHPLRLNLYRDGLAVSLQAAPGYEYGLHIQPPGAETPMESTDRTEYEKVADGIYYFAQKR